MSDQEQTDDGDDYSALSGFFFYMFIVHPCTAWILKPGRFERKKSIMYAIAFLAALAAIKTGKSPPRGAAQRPVGNHLRVELMVPRESGFQGSLLASFAAPFSLFSRPRSSP